MSSHSRVALVTGANRGIGLAIARSLCQQFSGDVVLTARDAAQGHAAVQQLQAEGLSPRFHLLDICNRQSIRALRDFLLKEYGGLDVLVNNAGINFNEDTTRLHFQAQMTMKTNFFGTRDVCTELLPLVRPQGRVVNVSSTLSLIALKRCRPDLQQKFTSETITEEELVGLMNKFVEDTKNEGHLKEGWPPMKFVPYAVSKVGLTVLSRIQARKLSERKTGDKILLNSCCPGWVRTDMGGPEALKSPEEGAETPVYLALLPSNAEGPQGDRVALVTGANRVIGLAIARSLCQQFSGDVVLTARDAAQGHAAVQQLQAEGLSPRFHLLDICNRQSIRALRDFLLKEYGGLDVLVNNAGINFNEDTTSLHFQAQMTMKTNFFGTRDVCTDLLPLVRPQGRVVNVSSTLSLIALKRCRPDLQQKFTSETITEEELVGLMNKFVEDTKNEGHLKEGWPPMKFVPYAVSKVGLTVLSRIQARKLSERKTGDKILLNSCCPGWVRTDMGGPEALKSPEEGAETPVYLALLPSNAEGPQGEFVSEKKVVKWEPDSELPAWLQLYGTL
ncbi:hypothetical protein MC885_000416 [Smutsia gigantea]|nr:hypothetical protein MC885_000416 [Smutsia gigantea]